MPPPLLYRQFDLAHGDTRLTCWLRADAGYREGHEITLRKDPVPRRWWRIVRRYETTLTDRPEIDWPVGGL